jgi:hypothetical protein
MSELIQAPIAHSVDLLVLGSSTGAVEAAVAAARGGARVLVVSSFTYPGEDVCATLNFWFDRRVEPGTQLCQRIFASETGRGGFPTPMAIKSALELAMIEAGVDLLYSSYPVYLLRGEAGELAGAVIGNRSGFQAVRAKVILDASERALAGRLTKAAFRPFVAGTKRFYRTVLSRRTEALGAEKRVQPFTIDGQEYRAYRHVLDLELPDASPLSFAKAEVEARLRTWDPQQVLSSDLISTLHTDQLDTGGNRQEELGNDGKLALGALRCGDDPLYLLSPLADLGSDVAQALTHPYRLMAAGRKLGQELADVCRTLSTPATIRVDTYGFEKLAGPDVVRRDAYFRYQGSAFVELDLGYSHPLAGVDVAVAGGGTAGAPAGISAARAGAATLVVELLPCLGGVSTEGRISKYWFGNRCGFTDEIDRGVHAMGPEPDYELTSALSNPEWKKSWYLQALNAENGAVLFHALTLAVAMDGPRLAGMLVATPYGSGLVRARAVIDSTGNADLAAAAGAETLNIGAEHLAVQGAGLGPLRPGLHYTNTDHTFVDDTDTRDTTRAFLAARSKFTADFDLVRIVNSRQRQQIVGEVTLAPLDFLTHRTFADTMVTARSNFDSHGFTIHPVFMAKAPDHDALKAHVPLRCLLPQGVERVLVTGLGVSCHRDSLPVIRMQPDVQNQGYAAGFLAAMAARENLDFRAVDIRKVQRHLVEVGILETEVMSHDDSPLPTAGQVRAAAESGTEDYAGLALIFACPEVSIPALQALFEKAPCAERRLRLAHLLGLLGDASGAGLLAAHLASQGWDEGWHYRGMGQFGMSLSPVDSMLVALSRTGCEASAPVILDKVNALTPSSEFSHVRASALALAAVALPEAAPKLAALLALASGHACLDYRSAVTGTDDNTENTAERNAELKEIYLARALLACGDFEGRGRAVLTQYSQDLHGHYARHSRGLLARDA